MHYWRFSLALLSITGATGAAVNAHASASLDVGLGPEDATWLRREVSHAEMSAAGEVKLHQHAQLHPAPASLISSPATPANIIATKSSGDVARSDGDTARSSRDVARTNENVAEQRVEKVFNGETIMKAVESFVPEMAALTPAPSKLEPVLAFESEQVMVGLSLTGTREAQPAKTKQADRNVAGPVKPVKDPVEAVSIAVPNVASVPKTVLVKSTSSTASHEPSGPRHRISPAALILIMVGSGLLGFIAVSRQAAKLFQKASKREARPEPDLEDEVGKFMKRRPSDARRKSKDEDDEDMPASKAMEPARTGDMGLGISNHPDSQVDKSDSDRQSDYAPKRGSKDMKPSPQEGESRKDSQSSEVVGEVHPADVGAGGSR